MLENLRNRTTGFAHELAEATAARLAEVGHGLRIEHSVWNDGEFHITANAPGLASEVGVGDYIYAGFFLTHAPGALTEAGVRIYRVECCNGMLSDQAEGQRFEFASQQPPVEWKQKLADVVARSFDGGCFDTDTMRLRKTTAEMLATPYEYLLHLAAQGLITDDEQAQIQHEFDSAADFTLYGLVNAVTRIAHKHRSDENWMRALRIENLGGEIAAGEYRPPLGSPVFY